MRNTKKRRYLLSEICVVGVDGDLTLGLTRLGRRQRHEDDDRRALLGGEGQQ